MAGVSGPYFTANDLGQMEPTLDPEGGLQCLGGRLKVDRSTKPSIKGDEADYKEQWPEEYDGCENGIFTDENCVPYAPPHPCVICFCVKITGTGEWVVQGERYRWTSNLVLPPNTTPYPINWWLGVSRTARVVTDPGAGATMDIGDLWNGVRLDCAYQCKTTSEEVEWCAHTNYIFCQTTPPGGQPGFELVTFGARPEGETFTPFDQCWYISAVGIAAPGCDC